jgi:hypothetical protein
MLIVSRCYQNIIMGAVRIQLTDVGRGGESVLGLTEESVDVSQRGALQCTSPESNKCIYINLPPPRMTRTNTTLPILLFVTL